MEGEEPLYIVDGNVNKHNIMEISREVPQKAKSRTAI
jgi:hypothetical protein